MSLPFCVARLYNSQPCVSGEVLGSSSISNRQLLNYLMGPSDICAEAEWHRFVTVTDCAFGPSFKGHLSLGGRLYESSIHGCGCTFVLVRSPLMIVFNTQKCSLHTPCYSVKDFDVVVFACRSLKGFVPDVFAMVYSALKFFMKMEISGSLPLTYVVDAARLVLPVPVNELCEEDRELCLEPFIYGFI